jgi:hypothetical protein
LFCLLQSTVLRFAIPRAFSSLVINIWKFQFFEYNLETLHKCPPTFLTIPMLRNTNNRPSDTKFDDLPAQITSHQMLLGFWVNYRGKLNFTVKGECDRSCWSLGGRHF